MYRANNTLKSLLQLLNYLLDSYPDILSVSECNELEQTPLHTACFAIPVQAARLVDVALAPVEASALEALHAEEVQLTLQHVEKARRYFQACYSWALLEDEQSKLPSDIIHEKLVLNEIGAVHEALQLLLSELQAVELVSAQPMNVFSGELPGSIRKVAG